MIHHAEGRRETQAGDARGCFAVFGGLFVLSGTFATVAALTAEMPALARLCVLAIGLAHLAGGLFAGWGESRTSVVTPAGVTITHRRLFRPAETRHVPAGTIEAVEVEDGRDSDGDATFRPQLRLTTGRRVPLTVQTTPSREQAVEIAAAVARRLERPDAVDV